MHTSVTLNASQLSSFVIPWIPLVVSGNHLDALLGEHHSLVGWPIYYCHGGDKVHRHISL
jgi:hypothetical protein